MTTTTTVSPFIVGEATQVELSDYKAPGGKRSVWRKEILPSGTRKYKGQTLDFSKINPACVEAFEDGVLDQLPFVFALSDNSHSDLPERYKGEVAKVSVEDDGKLFGYFDFSEYPDTAAYVEKNKKFGVSSRIEVNYERPDTGKTYSYALSHVCGTLRPHIRGLSPWEKIELSESFNVKDNEIVDLSTSVVDDTGTEIQNEKDKEGEKLVALEISEDELAGLRKFMSDYQVAQKAAEDFAKESEVTDDTKTVATLSEAQSLALTEATKRADMAVKLARESQIELAETRWTSRKRDLVLAGVPPHILDLAEPVLKMPQRATIELSDGGESLDASKTLNDVLEACKGMINLSEETGHSFLDNNNVSDKDYDAFAKDFFEEFNAHHA